MPAAELAPERRYTTHLLTALAALVVAASIGVAFAPVLAIHAPLVLIALAPLGRHMVIVAPVTDPIPFVAVAAARRLLACTLVYYLARAYGEDGIAWVENRYRRLGRFVRAFERLFRRAAPVAAVLLPGMSSPMAGAVRMPAAWFLPLAATGLVFWSSVTYVVGDALSEWILPILEFVREHLVSTTAACAAAVLLYRWIRKRRTDADPPPALP